MKLFGPVLAPIFISACVGLIVFVSMGIGQPGYGPMLNWAQCYATSAVLGETNGDEYISLVGPLIACSFHSFLFLLIPPSHEKAKATIKEAHGRFKAPVIYKVANQLADWALGPEEERPTSLVNDEEASLGSLGKLS